MSQAVPGSGRGTMLALIVNAGQPEDLVLKLFTNDIVPRDDDDHLSYAEATGFGYAPITLDGKKWKGEKGPPVSVQYAQQTFQFTGPIGKLYGYYLVQQKSKKLMWAERFADGPYHVVYAGSKIEVTARLEMKAF